MAVTSRAGCNRGVSGTESTYPVLADMVSQFDDDVPYICVDQGCLVKHKHCIIDIQSAIG